MTTWLLRLLAALMVGCTVALLQEGSVFLAVLTGICAVVNTLAALRCKNAIRGK